MAQGLPAFENLRVLEIRENPGVGGAALPTRAFSIHAALPTRAFSIHAALPTRAFSIHAALPTRAFSICAHVLVTNAFFSVHFSVLAQNLQHCSNLKVRTRALTHAHLLLSASATLPLCFLFSAPFHAPSKVLNIAACGLGMHGSYVLEAILPRLFQLEDLYLTNNYITGVIMQRLAPSLEKLTCLRKLFLQQNDLGLKGAKALRSSFVFMTSLTLLTLDYCVLRDEGLDEIAHGLHHLTLMETLRINHNGLGLIKVEEDHKVCEVLANSLSRMKNLKKVELAQSGFGPTDAMTIANALLAANSTAEVDDKKVKEVLKHLRAGNKDSAQKAAMSTDFDDLESQPMRCMLSEVYSHNIVRHQPINKNQCGGCGSPRVSIVANFFKGKKMGVETRRASFIGDKGSYNEDVVMKTVPYVPRVTCYNPRHTLTPQNTFVTICFSFFKRYPKVDEKAERKRLDQELNILCRVSSHNDDFLELLSISFHYEDNWKIDRTAPQHLRKCFLSAIVPFYGGGTLCERLWKGSSPCAGDHMQSVDALPLTSMAQKYHLARGIARALHHCHQLDIVHSDLCCCNILMKRNREASREVAWSVKVANTGVLPDPDSLSKRREYLAPELLSALSDLGGTSASPSRSHSPPCSHSSSSTPSHSPPLHSVGSPGLASMMFTKESDVFALGITLLQLFRHTLKDCRANICKFAADETAGELRIPWFPNDPPPPSCCLLPSALQDVVSSCTKRDPKARPSAAHIRSPSFFRFCFLLSIIGTTFWYFLILAPFPHLYSTLCSGILEKLGDEAPTASFEWLLLQ